MNSELGGNRVTRCCTEVKWLVKTDGREACLEKQGRKKSEEDGEIGEELREKKKKGETNRK